MRRGRVLRQRDFVRLWSAQAVSAVGFRITRTALPIIAVASVGASGLELGAMAALTLGPSVLVSLALGGVIDRSRKRPVLIASDIARFVAVLSLPIAAWTGILGMGQLYAVGAVVGIATSLFQIADNAYLPTLLDKDLLVEGNATIEATESVAEIAGPSLAGLLIHALTAPIAVLFDAIGYLVSALLIGSIRKPEAPAAVEEAPSVWRDIALGFGASWGHPLVRPLLLSAAAATFVGGTFAALYMKFLLEDLDLEVGTIGLVVAMGGVGSLFGAIGSARMTARIGLGPTMVICMFVTEIAGLLIPAASGPTWLVLAFLFAHQLLADGFHVAFLVQAVSLRQRVLPLEVLARTNAAFLAVTGALLPLGALAAGVLADAVGVRPALWIGMAASVAAPLVLLPLWRVKEAPVTSPAAAPTETTPSPASAAGPPRGSA